MSIEQDQYFILTAILQAIRATNGLLTSQVGLLRSLLSQGASELADLDKLVDDFKATNVSAFRVTMGSITKQGAKSMAAPKVHSFASSAGTLMDDEQGVMVAQGLAADGVTPVAIPASMIPSWSADVSTFGTIDPTIDPSGATCGWKSVIKQAGVTNVTVSGTNADGTIATGTMVVTTTLDPTEADINQFGVTMTNVTKQTLTQP